jgi:two-component system, cell cycle sensor histidine kinase and response regulator CckA
MTPMIPACPLLDAVPRERLIAGLTCESDDEYLRWLVQILREVAGVGFAFVGELVGEDEDRVQTVALATPDGPGENFAYDLADTPCATVIGSTYACLFPCQVAPQFPKDLLLVEMGIESYVGVALLGASGRVNGLMVLLDTQPVADERQAPLEALLHAFRARTEAVLAHRRAQRDLEAFEAQLGSIGSDDPALEFTRATTQALRVKLAFVARFVDRERTRLRTLAVSVGGKRGQDFEFALAGSPCEATDEHGTIIVAERASTGFPAAEFLRAYEAEGFLGRALRDPHGVPLGYFGIVHDRPLHRSSAEHPVFKLITERVAFALERLEAVDQRRAAERKLLESQRIESLGILAGGVAHDFSNLLVGVLGNADLALASLDAGAPDRAHQARPHVEGIVEAAKQASRLCAQMLAYAGKAQLETTRFEVGGLIEQVTSLLRASIPKNCKIDLRLAGAPIWIEGDSTQITQILMNLVTNAADAIGEAQGTITVSAGVRECGAAELVDFVGGTSLEPGTYACVRVEDDGCGMSEETRARVFDPFFTTKPRGHGLGLAAMLGIVARHRGGVRVQSELGRGSCFGLCLPIVAPESVEQREPGSEASSTGTARVLVVDDEPVVRRVVGAMLTSVGHEVLFAGDGLEALELFGAQAGRIDVVLLDLDLPKLDGVETMTRMRAIDPRVKIVLSSGRTDVDGLDGAAKPDRVIPKPYRMQTLLDELAALLER